MNLSPTASSVSTSTTSLSTSSTSNSTLHPGSVLSTSLRRRSVDTGGLNLVVNDTTGSGSGRGYGGWVEQDGENPAATGVAELVIAWREETTTMIAQAHPGKHPTSPSIPPTDPRRAKYIEELSEWGFDCTNLSMDDVLFCSIMLFELLFSIEGMERDIGLSLDHIALFLAHVSRLYREQSNYHNFQHALDVLQATYYYLYSAGCVPHLAILNVRGPDSGSETSLSQGVTGGKPLAPLSQQRNIWHRQRGAVDSLLQRILRNEDIFALFVAAIGHDIGHPGLNNAFLNKTKTPVSELFGDKSVLERMHCTLLLQVLRQHGMGHLLDRPASRASLFSSSSHTRQRLESDPGVITRDEKSIISTTSDVPETPSYGSTSSSYSSSLRPTLKKSTSLNQGSSADGADKPGTDFRTLLSDIILATDMGVHSKWLKELNDFIESQDRAPHSTESKGLTEKEKKEAEQKTRTLLCQALIKCADISNPSRPPPTCEHWSMSLIAEWSNQRELEKQLSLEQSFGDTGDPKAVLASQIGFTKHFTLPLYQNTKPIIPVMVDFVDQCDKNLTMWLAKQADLVSEFVDPTSTCVNESPVSRFPFYFHGTLPPDTSTMFPLAVPPVLQMPAPQISWPPASSSGSDSEKSSSGHLPLGSTNGHIPHSEPSSPIVTDVDIALFKYHHTSHTELPQVSIPSAQSATTSVSSGSSSFPLLKTGSTLSNSPLFSPGSTTTSSSSTSRSDAPSPAPSNATSANRDSLRAVLDAHGRPKARKWESRASWQGMIPVGSSPISFTIPPSITTTPAPKEVSGADGTTKESEGNAW